MSKDKMSVSTKEYTVQAYIDNLRRREEDPIKPGCLDIHPEHQRNFVTNLEWANKVICHFMFHKQLNPVIFHTIHRSDGFRYYESLDGKQRSSAFIRLVENKFKFKNVKKHMRSQDSYTTEMLAACDNKYFCDWPANYKSSFLNMGIPVTVYHYTMTEEETTDFFKDLQNSSRTSAGEVLHSFAGTRSIIKIMPEIMKRCESERIWKKKSTRSADKGERFKDLHVFTCMAYHFLKAPQSNKDVPNEDLIEWVTKEGNNYTPEMLAPFVKAAKKAMDLMDRMDIGHASAKNKVVCFFFLITRPPPDGVLAAIEQKYTVTQDLELPEVRGRADQAWRWYVHLTNNYGKCDV